MHGLFRTLTDNMAVGVSKGFDKRLQLIGVGYCAVVEGKDIVLSLGFSHPVRMRPFQKGLAKCSLVSYSCSPKYGIKVQKCPYLFKIFGNLPKYRGSIVISYVFWDYMSKILDYF